MLISVTSEYTSAYPSAASKDVMRDTFCSIMGTYTVEAAFPIHYHNNLLNDV